jgi:hypothetical protein
MVLSHTYISKETFRLFSLSTYRWEIDTTELILRGCVHLHVVIFLGLRKKNKRIKKKKTFFFRIITCKIFNGNSRRTLFVHYTNSLSLLRFF